MNELRSLREKRGITQKKAAEMLGVSLRAYQNYENASTENNGIKYTYCLQKMKEFCLFNENRGVYSIDEIAEICSAIFENYSVEYCILFGSYARGEAKDDSDIDLLISCDITGMKFFGLIEELRQQLHKKIDLLNLAQLNNNQVLVSEILRDGVRIYDSGKR